MTRADATQHEVSEMSLDNTFVPCPICASPNIFVVDEKRAGGVRKVKRECVCGETWWNSEPTTDKPPDSLPPKQRFTHEDWKREVLQEMSNMDWNSDEALALRKRGF